MLQMGNSWKIGPGFMVFLLLVSGCSTYKETFDCPAGVGVGCKSVSTVDALLEVGQLPIAADEAKENQYSEPTHIPLGPVSLQTNAARTPDAKLRIWLAGYADEHGVYRSDCYLYLASDYLGKPQELQQYAKSGETPA
ncbi:MAG: hypothetical protein ABFQ95_01570 [Pseudomonadota bacterium]